jgi:predicted transcriptional regulator
MNSAATKRSPHVETPTERALPADELSVAARAGMPRLCTIKEIAVEAGVSSTTVHRVIHGEMMVRRQTYQRVIAAMRRLNAERLALFTSAAHADLV